MLKDKLRILRIPNVFERFFWLQATLQIFMSLNSKSFTHRSWFSRLFSRREFIDENKMNILYGRDNASDCSKP